ncbi:ABC transporter permease [Salipaludibacillus sp. HK11]|uniref:ABC transporter permease n=1 Tax=Salipaludibacillus sp. HK11 TaxID=3394320 RepID=UPI0039FC0964
MAIIRMLIRKMINNLWIVGSLLLGIVITVALVTSIPIYTSGVLEKMLISDMEDYQIDNEVYAGQLNHFMSFGSVEESAQQEIEEMESYFHNTLSDYIDLSVKNHVTRLSTKKLPIFYQDEELYDNESNNYFHIDSLTGLEDHIEIINGVMPSNKPVDGVYEVMVTETALYELDAVLGTEFSIELEDGETVLVKPVGVFEASNSQDLYWFDSLSSYDESIIMRDELFREDIFSRDMNALFYVRMNAAFDYHQLSLVDIDRLVTVENRLDRNTNEIMGAEIYSTNEFPAQGIMLEYRERETQLTALMWSLNVPVLIMLALYLFMVSRLIVDRQKTEIAIFRSRGAARWKVMFIYLLEVSMLGVIALFIGPLLGLGISRILGASSGFLEFVQRTALPVSLTNEAYMYAFWTVVACVFMVMIPVFLAACENIISHKQDSARMQGHAWWHKLYLDVILLLITLYGWTVFEHRQSASEGSVNGDMIQIDPLLFLIPTFFIIGLGLMCLRIYPWVIRLVNWLGKKHWSPAMFATLVQVGRSSRQYQFFMLFLIMTIAVGIYSAGAARTINANMEEQIQYDFGADVRLESHWENNAPIESMGGAGMSPGSDTEEEDPGDEDVFVDSQADVIQYSEPPFTPYQQLSGVEHSAKVFNKSGVTIQSIGNSMSWTDMMAINTDEFAQTAWFKPQLLDTHWYNYLNLIGKEPSSVLISESVASQLGVGQGDYIDISWQGRDSAQFVVYETISYWPSWNPHPEEDGRAPGLVVANLPYVQNVLGLEPYEVWLDMEDKASSEALYDNIREQELSVVGIQDSRQELIALNNSAFLLGINGALTLGFLIALAVSFFGFLLYWILTMKSRILQYGIFRAMGLSFKQMLLMITSEQILTSGMACLFGVFIGGLTTRIFVPLFSLFFEAGRVPPFEVVFETSDQIQLYVFVSIMIIVGLGILSWLLSRIRIHEAVKLGED